MKELPKVDRCGIPKPAHNNLMRSTIPDVPYAESTMRSSGRDFRIVANSSKTSFGAESNTAKPIGRLPKQRPNLMGAGKPHMLKNQNDSIRAMLGGKDSVQSSKPTLDPIDPNKIRSMRNSSVKAFGGGTARGSNFSGTPQIGNVKD